MSDIHRTILLHTALVISMARDWKSPSSLVIDRSTGSVQFRGSMRTSCIRILLGLSACVAVLGSSTASRAEEPYDDNYVSPHSFSTPMHVLYATSVNGIGLALDSMMIDEPYERDRYLLMCPQGTVVKEVTVLFDHSDGDIDIHTFTVDGTDVRDSYSTSDEESIHVYDLRRETMIVDVLGYGGATNSYSVNFTCGVR